MVPKTLNRGAEVECRRLLANGQTHLCEIQGLWTHGSDCKKKKSSQNIYILFTDSLRINNAVSF